MKRLFAFLLMLCVLCIPVLSVGCNKTKDEKIPTIYIDTQDEVEPYDKKTYINCSFKLDFAGEYSFSVDMKENYGDEDSVGIRLRGNSTMQFIKRPYRLKFENKQSLFGSKPNKSWVLLADYLDPSAIRNYSAFALSRKFENLEFTPMTQHVYVYLNGHYKGLYLLTDQVDENAGRTDVETDFDAATDTDFPFQIEMSDDGDKDLTSKDYFVDEHLGTVEVKYPEYGDYEDENDKVLNYIKEYVNAFSTLLTNGNKPIDVSFRDQKVVLSDLVDEGSLMDYMLVNEIMGNGDARFRSIHCYKKKNGKLTFGPVWDFDNAAIADWSGQPAKDDDLSIANKIYSWKDGEIWKKWLRIDNNAERLYNRYIEKRDVIFEVIDEMKEYKPTISTFGRTNAQTWYKDAELFEQQYQFVLDYLESRYSSLETILYLIKNGTIVL